MTTFLSINSTDVLPILTKQEAALYLRMSDKTLQDKIKNNPTWRQHFWKEGSEWRTSALMLIRLQYALVNQQAEFDSMIDAHGLN
jgi:hypothetical protein